MSKNKNKKSNTRQAPAAAATQTPDRLAVIDRLITALGTGYSATTASGVDQVIPILGPVSAKKVKAHLVKKLLEL